MEYVKSYKIIDTIQIEKIPSKNIILFPGKGNLLTLEVTIMDNGSSTSSSEMISEPNLPAKPSFRKTALFSSEFITDIDFLARYWVAVKTQNGLFEIKGKFKNSYILEVEKISTTIPLDHL